MVCVFVDICVSLVCFVDICRDEKMFSVYRVSYLVFTNYVGMRGRVCVGVFCRHLQRLEFILR
jgi:hypothetical protein